MTEPSNVLDSYVPIYDAIPDKWEDAQAFLTEQLREITNGVNVRDYAFYSDAETLSGQQWVPGSADPTAFRDVFRKVISLGGLPDFGAVDPKNVSHGITTSINTCVTRLYGTANDPGAATLILGIPLPYVDTTGAFTSVGIEMDATNIIINGDGATDMSAFTCAWVVVEWLDEA